MRPSGEPVTLSVTVTAHRAPPPGRKAPYRVLVEDETGDVALVFFNGQRPRLEKLLPLGERRYVSGRDRAPGRPAPDGSSRPGPRRTGHRGPAVGGSDLRTDRGAVLAGGRASSWARPSSGFRLCPNGRTGPGWSATATRPSPTRCVALHRPDNAGAGLRGGHGPVALRAAASPTTSSSPRSSPSPSCAAACAACRAGSMPATDASSPG